MKLARVIATPAIPLMGAGGSSPPVTPEIEILTRDGSTILTRDGSTVIARAS